MKTDAASVLLAGGEAYALPATLAPAGGGYHLRTTADGGLDWARNDAMAINGAVSDLSGPLPNLAAAENRLGTIYATELNAATLASASAVQFKLNNATRWQVTAAGILPMSNGSYDVGGSSMRPRTVYANTLNADDLTLGHAYVKAVRSGYGLDLYANGEIFQRLHQPTASVQFKKPVRIENGLTPGELQIYETYTSETSYGRLRAHYDAASASWAIGSEVAGAGIVRPLVLQPGTGPLLVGKTANVGDDKVQVLGTITSGNPSHTNPATGTVKVVAGAAGTAGRLIFASKYNNFAAGIASYAVDDLYERDLRFYTKSGAAGSADGPERMRITGAGNVLIGSINDNGPAFVVARPTSQPILRIDNQGSTTAAHAPRIEFYRNSSVNAFIEYGPGSGDLLFQNNWANPGADFVFRSQGATEVARISGTGLGTFAGGVETAGKLQVAGQLQFGGAIAATALGALSHVMPIRNEAGVLLGYYPIYSSYS